MKTLKTNYTIIGWSSKRADYSNSQDSILHEPEMFEAVRKASKTVECENGRFLHQIELCNLITNGETGEFEDLEIIDQFSFTCDLDYQL